MRECIAFALVIIFCLMSDGIMDMYGIVGFLIGLFLVGVLSFWLLVCSSIDER